MSAVYGPVLQNGRMLLLLPILALGLATPPRAQGGPDTCLAFVSTNLAKGNGNFYTYERFSDQNLTIAAGDTLVYSVLLDQKVPEAKGGVDIEFADVARRMDMAVQVTR